MMKRARPTGPNGGTCQTIGTAESKSKSTNRDRATSVGPPEQSDPGPDHRDQPRKAADQLEGAD